MKLGPAEIFRHMMLVVSHSAAFKFELASISFNAQVLLAIVACQ